MDEIAKRGDSPGPNRRFNLLIGLVALLALIGVAYRAIPPSHLTIATGPVGGSYFENAEKYRLALKRQGVSLALHPVPNSLDIIQEVNNDRDGVEVGFVAQALSPDDYPNVFSLGAIERQPLFVFVAKTLGSISSPAELRGRQLVMPPRRSVSSEMATSLLARYGVTPANTRMDYMPIAQAVEALSAHRYDAGFFVLDPEDGFIESLARDPDLLLLDLHDALTLSRLDPSLSEIVLPRGVFDLEKQIPPQDVHMVAATINVVVRKRVPQALVYLLLEAMADVHRGSTLISAAGTFPTIVDTALPPHPLAVDFEKNGLPWAYQNLPRWMAPLISSYLVIVLLLVIVVELWSSLLYLAQLADFLHVHFWLRVLSRIERRARDGHGLRTADIRLVDLAERALSRSDRRRRGEQLIARIRSAHS